MKTKLQHKKEPPYAFRLCELHLKLIKGLMQAAQDGQEVTPAKAFLRYFGGHPIVLTQKLCAAPYCTARGAVARIELK